MKELPDHPVQGARLPKQYSELAGIALLSIATNLVTSEGFLPDVDPVITLYSGPRRASM